MSYVDLKWVYRIKGEDIPEYLEEKYGPMVDKNNNIPQSRDVPLNDLLSDYDFVVKLLESICCQLNDEDLNDVVNYEEGRKSTIKWGIWHISDHSRYHPANINQLRKWYTQQK
ncbi:DinB family protein [Paenibacillus sp. TY11]|uniref:DinB family protein n=1 Tax=Paenibacillus sp. TY11 TaxID=3448633 RepID=UPI00403907F2